MKNLPNILKEAKATRERLDYEARINHPAQDMADPKNWREGDVVKVSFYSREAKIIPFPNGEILRSDQRVMVEADDKAFGHVWVGDLKWLRR